MISVMFYNILDAWICYIGVFYSFAENVIVTSLRVSSQVHALALVLRTERFAGHSVAVMLVNLAGDSIDRTDSTSSRPGQVMALVLSCFCVSQGNDGLVRLSVNTSLLGYPQSYFPRVFRELRDYNTKLLRSERFWLIIVALKQSNRQARLMRILLISLILRHSFCSKFCILIELRMEFRVLAYAQCC
jgi:hypothetical protein